MHSWHKAAISKLQSHVAAEFSNLHPQRKVSALPNVPVGFFGHTVGYNKSFSILIPVWGVRKKCNVEACFAPFTCQRSVSPTEKSGAGAKEDCSRRPKWRKRLLRKKTKEIWSPLTSLLMPPRTGHREWNIVLFLAFTPKKKAVKVKIKFSKVCLSQ